jgi:hypothetical protein
VLEEEEKKTLTVPYILIYCTVIHTVLSLYTPAVTATGNNKLDACDGNNRCQGKICPNR